MSNQVNMAPQPKQKVVAALLAFFLGTLGIHNFYLGYKTKAIIQLVVTIVGWITAVFIVGIFLVIGIAIWAFVEFIMILIGKINDSTGAALVYDGGHNGPKTQIVQQTPLSRGGFIHRGHLCDRLDIVDHICVAPAGI